MADPATEKWTYVSLLIVGIIALPMAGFPYSAILLQNEVLLMIMLPLVYLFLPFLGAFIVAFVFTVRGLVRGPNAIRRRLALWYGCAVLFGVQAALLELTGAQAAPLDPFTRPGPLPSTTVLLFAVLSFAPLLAMIIMPARWLRRHRGDSSATGRPSSAA